LKKKQLCYNLANMAINDYDHSIFMIEVDKIKANPYQPRQEFNADRLRDLADSIRQYGVLQPLVVTRKEVERPEGGLTTEYELIAGERRWRASKLAGLSLVPALIRSGEHADKVKLEMAIIENLQREDLNSVDRAFAFGRLAKEFNLTHVEIAKRVGKSREYVSNTIRILGLPQEVLDAVVAGKITEGHTRPILMLVDRPEEQAALFQEIMLKRLSVRDAEAMARRIAIDRARKRELMLDPEFVEMEEKLTERLGTRVRVEKRGGNKSGRVLIDFFTDSDLSKILQAIGKGWNAPELKLAEGSEPDLVLTDNPELVDDSTPEDQIETPVIDPDDEALYQIRNFSL
jgi:ParB family chromosome partitioning protein